MDRNLMINLTNDLGNASSVLEIKTLERKYSNIRHPFVFYTFGLAYQLKNDNKSAFENYFKACELGIRNYNQYLNNFFSDSVGSPLAYILIEFPLTKLDINIQFNLFASSYVFLSSAIEQSGIDAYESLRNRADLFRKYEGKLTDGFLSKYFGIGCISLVLSLSDYYYSYKGYNKYGETRLAQKYLNNAKNIHEWLEDITVDGKNADSYSLEEISLIGKKRHVSLFANSKQEFLNGAFSVDFNMIKSIYLNNNY